MTSSHWSCTFSGKKMLHLQENVALTRKSCKCNIFLPMQHFLDFSGKKILPMQHFLDNATFFCCIGKIFLPLESRKCCIVKKMLHWQDFLATKVKKMLHWQENVGFARFSCQCNIFLQMQHFLATKCTSAL